MKCLLLAVFVAGLIQCSSIQNEGNEDVGSGVPETTMCM